MRALFIGRFQPFHNGHKAVCEYIAKETDELIIGIGSSQMSHEPKHPFTAGERVLMITRALHDLPIPLYVLPIPDVNRNAIWVAHVMAMVPSFDVVYSSNPQVIRLFAEAGIPVKSAPMVEREVLSGTKIRERMVAGTEWEPYVPVETAEVIRSIDGLARMAEVGRRDE